jgi:hypothetical protein
MDREVTMPLSVITVRKKTGCATCQSCQGTEPQAGPTLLGTNPLFQIIGRDGHVWMIYENGEVSGFPDDVMIVNHALPLLNSLRGKQQLPCPSVTDK